MSVISRNHFTKSFALAVDNPKSWSSAFFLLGLFLRLHVCVVTVAFLLSSSSMRKLLQQFMM